MSRPTVQTQIRLLLPNRVPTANYNTCISHRHISYCTTTLYDLRLIFFFAKLGSPTFKLK